MNKIDFTKYNFLNVSRMIMALIVVANHIHPFYKLITNQFLVNICNFVLSLAVPFFFISSGFYLGIKIKDINDISNDEFDYIKKHRNKSLKLYLIFTCVYFPLTLYGFYQDNLSFFSSIVNFFRGFLFVGENFNSWILWYLLAEIYALSFILLFRRFINNNKKMFAFGMILFVLGIFIDCIYHYNFFTNISFFGKVLKFFIPNGRIFNALIYYSLGIYLSKIKLKLKKECVLGLNVFLLLFTTYVNNFIFTKFSVLVFSVFLFYLLIDIRIKENFFTILCREISVNMYFFHLLVWSFLSLFLEGNIHNNYGIFYYISTVFLIILYSLIKLKISMKKYKKR